MANAAVISRMTKEIRMLQTDPPPGVWAAPVGDRVTQLEAQLQGPKDTVYEGGVFKLSVDIPARFIGAVAKHIQTTPAMRTQARRRAACRYPFEPPKVKFVTPVYHPNIDPEGRICLDILNMPPKGAWKPSLNVPTLLASIGLLLAEPNPDDGLVTDVTAEFKHQRAVFDAKARQWTQRHAVQGASGGGGQANPEDAAPAQAEAAQRQQQQPQGERQREQQPPHAEGQRSEALEAGSKENSRPEREAEQAGEAGKQQGPAAEEPVQQQPKRARLALRK